jgi:hypothetical protein
LIQEAQKKSPALWQSVAAAFFGVQSSRNRRRDFASGKPIQYIIVTVVKLVLRNAGL